MGEKRTFECEFAPDGQDYMDGLAIDISIDKVTGDFPDRVFVEKITGKKVRLTVEVLDDDHLEMDKLERE